MSAELAEAEETKARKWKPYSEYKPSGVEWLGEIPAHWKTKPLKRLITNQIVKGEGRVLPFIALEFIEPMTGQIVSNFEWRDVAADEYVVFAPNDVLFGKLRPYLRKHFLADREGCCATELLVLRAMKDSYLPSYLHYLVQSDPFVILTDASSYGTKMPRTSWEKISSNYFWIPPRAEQRGIVTFLNQETAKIDSLVAKREQLIALVEEKRKAIISHAVTKGLNPDAPMKDSGVDWIGEIPAQWKPITLRRVCTVQQGLQIAQSERFAEPSPDRYEYITIKSINSKNNADTKEYVENPPHKVTCTPDDVLLARTGATGEVISGQAGVFHNNFFKIIFDSKIITRDYLIYYLKNSLVKQYLLLMAGTTTIPDLNHGEFLDTPFPLPSLEEQGTIIEYLDRESGKYNSIIKTVEEALDKLHEHRTALISAAVTGKIDVRGEAG